MANELLLSVALEFAKDGVEYDRRVDDLERDVAAKLVNCGTQSIGNSEEALDLGNVAAGGYLFLRNAETSESAGTISIRQGTGASDLIDLIPGDFALFRLSIDATAPFAICDAAAGALLEVLLLSA